MLALCRQMPRIARREKAMGINRPSPAWKSQPHAPSDRAAAMEPTETMRVAKTPITQAADEIPTAAGDTARRAPAEVATPFPPLKRRVTGQLCPATAAQAQTRFRARPWAGN